MKRNALWLAIAFAIAFAIACGEEADSVSMPEPTGSGTDSDAGWTDDASLPWEDESDAGETLDPDGGTPGCSPSNCAGCCNAAGNCVTGTANNACGIDGVACATCSPGQICNLVHECAIDPDRPWTFQVSRVEVEQLKPNGDSWDPGAGKPEIFVEFNWTGAPSAVQTDRREDTLTATWNPPQGITVAMLNLTEGIKVKIVDHDPLSNDDEIAAEKTIALTEQELAAGTLTINDWGAAKKVVFVFKPQ